MGIGSFLVKISFSEFVRSMGCMSELKHTVLWSLVCFYVYSLLIIKMIHKK